MPDQHPQEVLFGENIRGKISVFSHFLLYKRSFLGSRMQKPLGFRQLDLWNNTGSISINFPSLMIRLCLEWTRTRTLTIRLKKVTRLSKQSSVSSLNLPARSLSYSLPFIDNPYYRGVKSNDEVILEIVKDIFEGVPADLLQEVSTFLSYSHILKKGDQELFQKNEHGLIPSLSTVLLQEIDRFNKLLSKMRSSLISLREAIQEIGLMSHELESLYYSLLNNQV